VSEKIETLTLDDVTLAFEGEEILRRCCFNFPMGQNCRVVFQDDRQKFFFFHALSQIEGFARGRYLLNGQDLTKMTFEEFLPYRLKIGFGFSTRGLIHNRTLRQNLELPLRFHRLCNEQELHEWLDHSVEYFGVQKDLEKRPAEVSPNSQKVILVLRAFIHKPEMVFLDTPELMLSTKLHANLLQLIDDHKKYHNLKHLIFSTYNEDLSDCLADQDIILRKKSLQLVERKTWKKVAL
jgi:ABC-type lipoprotein export system ATPase subunit